MTMTKQHFEMVAQATAETIAHRGEANPAICEIAMRQCFAFKAANPRFDPLRFLIASGFSNDEATDIARRID